MVADYLRDPASPSIRGYNYQMVASFGREDEIDMSLEYEDSTKFTCDAPAGDPIRSLTESAKNTSIVIINESHAEPRHRVFIRDLAIALRKIGYTHYAAETLSETAPGRVSGRTVESDGYYTHDPVYARVLADIRDMGYLPVAYEMRPEQRPPEDANVAQQISAREQAQVENLLSAVLLAAPNTRLLIHVGHTHVAERPAMDDALWMAARLKKTTGIDPLTISLTDCSAHGDAPVLSRRAVSINGAERPLLTDVMVGLPAKTFTDNRPDYRREIGDRDTPILSALRPVDTPVLIEARPFGASDDVVPTDRLYVRPGEALPLLLPPGAFSIWSFNENGPVAGPVQVVVESPGD